MVYVINFFVGTGLVVLTAALVTAALVTFLNWSVKHDLKVDDEENVSQP